MKFCVCQRGLLYNTMEYRMERQTLDEAKKSEVGCGWRQGKAWKDDNSLILGKEEVEARGPTN